MPYTTLQALINQAERQVRAEAYEEAIALCHAVLRRYPRYARCYRILGEAYLGLGEHEEAANLFRRSLGVDVEDAIAYAGLSIIFEERGLLDEAIWQMERAFELAPGRDELRRELARLYEQRGSPARVMLTRGALAHLYARGGLLNKAIGELRNLLAREPYRLDLRVALARVLWRAGRRREAAETSQGILDVAPNCLVARLILGTYWCEEGRGEEGRALLEGAQDLDPDNREATRLLGRSVRLPTRAERVEPEGDLTGGDEFAVEEQERTWLERPLAASPAKAVAPEEALPVAPGELQDAEGRVVTLMTGQILTATSELPVAEMPGPETEQASGILAEEPDALEVPLQATTQPGQPADELLVEAERPAEQPEAVPGANPDVDLPEVLSPAIALRRQLEAAPDDNDTRLALARTLVENGNLAEALPLYDVLAAPESGYLDVALGDLEKLAQTDNHNRLLREVLGDAYARAGRFQEAMRMYHWLLEHQGGRE